MFPMVVGDYNRATAMKNQGEGYIRLKYAKVTEDYFEFVWGYCQDEDHYDEMTVRRVGSIVEEGVMMYYNSTNERGYTRLYKLAEEVEDYETSEISPSSPSEDNLSSLITEESESTAPASWGEKSSQ